MSRSPEEFLAAWNTQDVGTVLGCYTEDVEYRDPNTRGMVTGHDALRRYLTKLFDGWQMHWRLRELFPLEYGDGSAVLWEATLGLKGSDRSVVVEGMDLAILRGRCLARNEVYFDRSPLAALLGDPEAANTAS
jgi:ketosteroid isomerase-like protein